MIVEGGHQLGNYPSAITARSFQYRNIPADFTERAHHSRNHSAVKPAEPFQLDKSSNVSCVGAFVELQNSYLQGVIGFVDTQKQ